MPKALDKPLAESIIPTIEVRLQGIENGLGFNIVGGIDTPHIPGHDGFFISRIRPNSAAAENGLLNIGDRIVAVNGTMITRMTHDQAVQIFKSASMECVLTVEPDAERILLSQPSDLIVRSPTSTNQSQRSGLKSTNSSRSSSPNAVKKKEKLSRNLLIVKENNKTLQSEHVEEHHDVLLAKESLGTGGSKENHLKDTEDVKRAKNEVEEKGTDRLGSANHVLKDSNDVTANGSVPIKKNKSVVPSSPSKTNVRTRTTSSTSSTYFAHSGPQKHLNHVQDDDEDKASTVSIAPSVAHSVIDDIPRTPKKPSSILDPSNPSILTEVLFVSVGVVALGAGILFTYRYLKRN